MFKKFALPLVFTLGLTACSTKVMPQFEGLDLSKRLVNTEKVNQYNVVVMHFWATSCTTCIEEMPQVINLYNNLKQQAPNQFEMVSVTMPKDPPMYVANYSQSKQLPFKVVMDTKNTIVKQFSVRLTPTTLVYHQQKLVKTLIGPPSNWQEFEADLLKLAKQS